MTLVVSIPLHDGAIIVADSRITYTLITGEEKRRDLGQKVYSLTSHIAVSFSGDVRTAGYLIDALGTVIDTDSRYRQIEWLNQHANRILSYAHRKASKIFPHGAGEASILIAGVSISRKTEPMPNWDIDAAPISSVTIYSVGPQIGNCRHRSIRSGSIAKLGSGSKMIPEDTTEELYENHREYEGLLGLKNNSPILGATGLEAWALELYIKDLILNSKSQHVGGLLQTVSINHEGTSYGSLFSLKDGTVVEGWAGERWQKTDRASGKIHELLGYDEIPPRSWLDIEELLLD